MDRWLQDVRYGYRQLVRQKGASIVAVLTLALGIGASTAIFSVIDAALLRPLPYPHPEQLVAISVEEPRPDGRVSRPTTSMGDLRAWQQATDVVSKVAGVGNAFRGRIVEGPEPERVSTLQVTEDYLSMYGVAPILGREFTRADMDYGGPSVVLLGYGYWQSHYGGSDDVIGGTIRLDEGPATIVGVVPASFNADTPLFQPLRVAPDLVDRRGTGRPSVYARLQPGVTVEQASDRLSGLTAGTLDREGATIPVRAVVESRLDTEVGRYSTTVTILTSAVGLILLIACVNVAGLLFARGTARESELAVRAALGASRGRMVGQLLTEAVVLALAGGAVGVLLAWLSHDVIVANLPLSLPQNSPASLNVVVLGATVALLVPTVLLFGLLPALRLSRVRLGLALSRGGRQPAASLSRRGSQGLIAVEVALAVVLVMGSGLMIRSFVRIASVDLGFDARGVLTMPVLPLEQDPAAHKAYYAALVDRLRAMPQVESVGLVDNFVLGGGTAFTSMRGSGDPAGVTVFDVLPGYFETIRATLTSGRLMTPADYASGYRGVVINESAARELFKDGPAVGRPIRRASARDGETWTVLGVIGDLFHGGPLNFRGGHQPQVFFPLEPTESDLIQAMTIVVRPAGRVPDLASRLREAAQAVGPQVLVERIRTADELFGDRVVTPRRRTVLLGLLGALGLVLALVGVFGMTAYAVTRRTREIGVRMAFGARPGQVVRAMLRDSAVPVALGVGIGLVGAAAGTRVIQSFLFETTPTDPVTFTLVAVGLVLAGCLAALVPAWRAAGVDPASTLRAE